MKPPRPKTVAYELLVRGDDDMADAIYRRLDRLVQDYHEDLKDARIAVAWCTSWKPDVDGRCTLGKCRKASDLDRELAEFDFVILLRKQFWDSSEVSDQQRDALLDHELCHATVKLDAAGEPCEDERGRLVFRLRKHDLEEFACIAERYGTWKRDLELFDRALNRSRQQPLLPELTETTHA